MYFNSWNNTVAQVVFDLNTGEQMVMRFSSNAISLMRVNVDGTETVLHVA